MWKRTCLKERGGREETQRAVHARLARPTSCCYHGYECVHLYACVVQIKPKALKRKSEMPFFCPLKRK